MVARWGSRNLPRFGESGLEERVTVCSRPRSRMGTENVFKARSQQSKAHFAFAASEVLLTRSADRSPLPLAPVPAQLRHPHIAGCRAYQGMA